MKEDHLPRGNVVEHEPTVVHGQDKHRCRYPRAPEDVADDDGPEGVLLVGQDVGHDGTCRGGDDVGDYWEQPRSVHRREGYLYLCLSNLLKTNDKETYTRRLHHGVRDVKVAGHGQGYVYPPENPGKDSCSVSPGWHADEDNHVDYRGETHRERPLNIVTHVSQDEIHSTKVSK